MQPERKKQHEERPDLAPKGQPDRMAPPDQIEPLDPNAGVGLTQGYVPDEDDSGEADLTNDLPTENNEENERPEGRRARR